MKAILFNKSDNIVLLFLLLVISVPILSSGKFEERKRMFYLAFLMAETPTQPSFLLPGDRWSQFSLKTIVLRFIGKEKSLKISMYIKLLSFSGSSRGHIRRTVDLLQFY